MEKLARYRATAFWTVMRKQGRSIRWLARETGVHETYISKMRKGERPILEPFAIAASNALGIPIEALFVPCESTTRNETDDGRNMTLEEVAN